VIETNVETWDKVMAINLKGPYLCCRAVVPHMIGQHYGKIINISSSAAYHFFPGFGAYSSSKAGLLAFTKVLSEEVKEYDVNVNALCLGLINTDRTRKRITGKEIGADPKEWLQPEDVADVVLYFASDLARSVHGAALDVFGKRR
jgi:NAD(P)-dependent dehydrogenase (short-subunit alcohol dehydrogenase family)